MTKGLCLGGPLHGYVMSSPDETFVHALLPKEGKEGVADTSQPLRKFRYHLVSVCDHAFWIPQDDYDQLSEEEVRFRVVNELVRHTVKGEK